MLNKKEKQIIQYLIKDKDKFVTSKELAAQLGCSDRTIRTYYKTLIEKLDFYSITTKTLLISVIVTIIC